MYFPRKAFRSAAAAVLMFTVFSACSSLRGASDPAPATTNLKILMTDDWASRPAFLAAVKEFEDRNRGVRVIIDKLPIRNMAEAVRGQVSANDPVDMVQWHAYAAGAQGLAEPVDDLWERAGLDRSEFFPGAMADVEWGDRIYGVPLDINALVLFYRPETFAAAGMQPPGEETTFGDLESYGRALAAAGEGNRVIAIANSYWAAYGWVRANGGDLVVVEDGEPRFTLDSPEVVQTLAFLARMARAGYAFAPDGTNSSADALALFRAGRAVIHASGSWDLPKLDKETLGTTYRAALMPRGITGSTRGTVTGGSSFFVPKGAKNRELAFELMQTITADKHALRLAKEEGRLPVRSRLYSDPFFEDPTLQVVLEQLETAHPLVIEAFPEAAHAFDAAFEAVMRDGVDPAVALAKAQATAEGSLTSPTG